jgi:hypothetical protein
VRLVSCTKNPFGFDGLVRFPQVADRQDRKCDAFRIPQRYPLTSGKPFGEFLRYVERDRHRPQSPGGEPHAVHHSFVIGAIEKPTERREPAAHQQLQIADLAPGQRPLG